MTCPVALYTGDHLADRQGALQHAAQEDPQPHPDDPHRSRAGPVDRADIVKGYEIEKGRYVVITDEEIKEVRLESTRTIDIERFVDADDIDRLVLERSLFPGPRRQDGGRGLRGHPRGHEEDRQDRAGPRGDAPPASGWWRWSRATGASSPTPCAATTRCATPAKSSTISPTASPIRRWSPIAEKIIEQQEGPFDPSQFNDRYEDALRALIEDKEKGHEPGHPRWRAERHRGHRPDGGPAAQPGRVKPPAPAQHPAARKAAPGAGQAPPKAGLPTAGRGAEDAVAAKLSTYRAKRDFKITAEPAEGRRLRFVIQKHAATRLHYDLRLELDGVFKSWAVTRGPSLDPADKRLAVEVEDHPLDYGDFEGTIPKGQYGGGTVMLWDRGYWAPEPGDDRPKACEGRAEVRLDGERLQGGWVLVRMKHDRNGGKRTNWLLIKHRDDAAREGDGDALTEGRPPRSPRAAPWTRSPPAKGRAPKRSCWPARRARPTRCGIPSAEAGRRPARPRRARQRRAKGPARSAKRAAARLRSRRRSSADRSTGRRRARAGCTRSSSTATGCSCASKAGEATLKTRKGLDWTASSPEIAAEAAALPDGIIDGEVVALDAQRRARFRRPAGGAVRRQDRRPGLLRLRPAVRRGRGPARACR